MENLYGLIGETLGHTYSPQIHDKILEETQTKGYYGLFQVKRENLKNVVSGLKALGYNGANVTIPYKLDIIKYLDGLSPEASKIGAINVINIDKNGMAIGYNTDYYGFGMMINHANIKIDGETAVILGTGGASKAVTQYLKDNGIKNIIMVSRDPKVAKQKYPDYKVIDYDELNKLNNCSIIINCTPIGMFPKTEFTPIDKKHLDKFNTAIDLVYNPSTTLLLKESKEKGLKTINGLYMLAAQAVKSQEIWNETKISSNVINNIMDIF
jgi:shikimate dehydrogenase